jgi:predicted nucleotidyltransferase
VSRLEAVLRRAARDLDALGARWALVGGLAVSARAEPRLTRDVDVVVAVATDAEAERLVHDLAARGYRVDAVVEQEATGRLATARVLPREEGAAGVVLDLLFASSGIEAEIVAGAEALEVLPTVTVPVASLPHLIALKILARDDRVRPLDRADLLALLQRAAPGDVADARAALALIAARGYARGRDLRADLDAMLRDTGPR